MERKAKTIPNITEMAVRGARQYMRLVKENGTYIKRRRTFGRNIFMFVLLKAFGTHTERDAIFNEILEAIKSAYMSTGLDRFNAVVPKDKREVLRDTYIEADDAYPIRVRTLPQERASFNICEILDSLERMCIMHNRWDANDPINTTMVTVNRILNSRLLFTVYLNYPRIRRVLETYKHVHIKTEEN